MSNDQSWDITASLNSAFTRALQDLNRCAQFSQLANQLAKLPDDLELPDADGALKLAPPGFDPDNPPGADIWGIVRHDFSEDCQRYAVVGMIGACETYFLQLFLIGDLVQALNVDRRIHLAQVCSLRQGLFERTRRMSPRSVLAEALKKLGGDSTSLTRMNWFDTLYKLRICLVHRGGVVREIDVEEDGRLHLIWRKLVMLIDDEPVPDLPVAWERDGILKMRMEDEQRSWAVGEPIKLASTEIRDAFYSLIAFCDQVHKEALRGVMLHFGSQSDE